MNPVTIPYTHEPRPDSGLTNPALGMWLFLASELMLFASLFSAYALLRLGAEQWPSGAERLHPLLGSINTILLVGASIAVGAAARRLAVSARPTAHRGLLLLAAATGAVFVALMVLECRLVVAAGYLPKTDVFSAIYFTLSGVLALHIVCGVAVAVALARSRTDQAGSENDHKTLVATAALNPKALQQRVTLLGWYWYFMSAIWIVLFAALYLL